MVDIDVTDEKKIYSAEMTNDEYHAHPALGSSNLKQILKNPYVFAMGLKQEQTQAMVIGSAVHKLVLEADDFYKEFAIMPDFNLRTNEGKNLKAMFEMDNVGKTVIKQSDYDLAVSCAGAVRKEAEQFLVGGVAEKAFFAELEGVQVKCKPDYYIESLGIVVDLKVVQDASPDGFVKQCANFGYYLQQALYTHVLRENGKEVNNFLFVAVEKDELNMVGMYELDYVAAEFGLGEARRAIEIYKNIEQYKQPVYKDTTDGQIIQTLTLPNWVYYAKGASI